MNNFPPLFHSRNTGLAAFVDAGILDASALYVADAISRGVGGLEPDVLLAAALAARAPRFGHVCVLLREVAESIVVDDARLAALEVLPWPDPEDWEALLAASPGVRHTQQPAGDVTLPLVWDGSRLYLERYWRYEQRVAENFLRGAESNGGLTAASPELDTVLDTFFGPEDPSSPDLQREAVRQALTSRLVVVAGGPGTGKTRTIARLLAAAHLLASRSKNSLEVALAAPTGKASARMTEAVHQEAQAAGLPEDLTTALTSSAAMTLHRLLGLQGSRKPRANHRNPLPHDLVVVDETSMVSLPLMAHLLDAVRLDATLILSGDPFQLASVEAGAVLGEIVAPFAAERPRGPLAGSIVLLERVHRFATLSPIAALSDAIRTGDADKAVALLRDDTSGDLSWVDATQDKEVARLQREVADSAVGVVRAAQEGDAVTGLRLAGKLKVLCATRLGPLGVSRWTTLIESLAEADLPEMRRAKPWYVGRPVIATRNNSLNGVFNGDTGLVVSRTPRPVVAFPDGDQHREMALSQVGDVDTWWAMTIHKSQGSEFERVIVALPPSPSPVLTRELLYTAVTRAKEQVTLVATESSLRAAIGRRLTRASGLAPKLWPSA
jgi:exodeoxyribonuclease V alpha subunit